MEQFLNDLQELFAMRAQANETTRPVIDRSIIAMIEKFAGTVKLRYYYHDPPQETEHPPCWWTIQPTCGGIPMNHCKGEKKQEQK